MKSLFEKYCQHASGIINYSVLAMFMCYCIYSIHQFRSSYILVFIIGLLSWSFVEYVFHRFLFHHVSKYPFLTKLVYLFHGIHHKYANTTNYIPFIQNVLFYGSGLLFIKLFTNESGFVFYLGFLIAVMYQVYIHNLVHEHQSKYFIKLQLHHSIHHRFPNYNFGVSTRFWDYLFGTLKTTKSFLY